MPSPFMLIAVAGAITGLLGVIYGATGKTPARQTSGLRLCQFGMGAAGLALIAAGVSAPDKTDALYGFLLLVFGTGVTAINARRDGRDHHG